MEVGTGRRVAGKVDWTTVSPREIFPLSEDMFDAAGTSQTARNAYYAEFNRYIFGL
jgi:HNH/endonuclease VII toxin of polymorphic toxin system component